MLVHRGGDKAGAARAAAPALVEHKMFNDLLFFSSMQLYLYMESDVLIMYKASTQQCT
jgi:hypothetical protein